MAGSEAGHDSADMIPAAKLERLLDRFAAIEAELASGAGGAAFVKAVTRTCRTVAGDPDGAGLSRLSQMPSLTSKKPPVP